MNAFLFLTFHTTISTKTCLFVSPAVYYRLSSMRYLLLLSLILTYGLPVIGQDTLSITYSEEPDTLTVRQKFIDRYGQFFMTRVPTRHIVKAGYTTSDVRGIGIAAGYEYKLLPVLSLEAAFFVKTNDAMDGMYANTFTKMRNGNYWAGGKVRWYYTMNQRIRHGLNANNFSGAYLAGSYEQPLMLFGNAIPDSPVRRIIGLVPGFQSRFSNLGHIDISVGAYYVDNTAKRKFSVENYDGSPRQYFVFSTQMTVGLALGDWRTATPAQFCEVLLCDEEKQNQWKLRFPELSLGVGQQMLRAGIAREARFGNSPFSLDINVNGELYNRDKAAFKGFSLKVGLQGRYYFLQKRQIRLGKSGNNLSGFYTAAEISNFHTRGITRNWHNDVNERYWAASASVGFQQRLFRNIYIDTAVSFNQFSMDLTYPLRLSQRQFSSRFALGFAF